MSVAPQLHSAPPAAGNGRFRTLAEWLAWQEQLHATAIELGLDRCRAVAARLGLLAPACPVISIAGTNGKGSSTRMLELAYRHAGYRVGRYTSPHLLRYNERICVAGVDIDDRQLCEAFARIDAARGDVSLTYFEFGTLAALDIFARSQLDIALLEVGLGGRLDAVNILDADAALLTTVDLDHERWLGSDRESIGREKAGIFRAGRPAVCSDPNPPRSVIDVATAVGADLRVAGRDFHATRDGDSRWHWRGRARRYDALPVPGIPHRHQLQNAAGVVEVIDVLAGRLPVPFPALERALAEFSLPGRLQVLRRRVPCVLDVAHNPQSAAALAENLAAMPCAGRTHLVIGMLNDKDHVRIFRLLAGSAQAWYVAGLPGERGTDAGTLAGLLRGVVADAPIEICADVGAALAAAMVAAGRDDRIVVTGSFLTVGAALQRLEADMRDATRSG
jgi:dihydrofolate synthase/folylpolyglutamate synthase